MRLTRLEPVHVDAKLVGWSARFSDAAGQARIATLGLGCLMDPTAFSQAVALQGVPYTPPCGADLTAWKSLVRDLTVWQTRRAG